MSYHRPSHPNYSPNWDSCGCGLGWVLVRTARPSHRRLRPPAFDIHRLAYSLSPPTTIWKIVSLYMEKCPLTVHCPCRHPASAVRRKVQTRFYEKAKNTHFFPLPRWQIRKNQSNFSDLTKNFFHFCHRRKLRPTCLCPPVG